MNLRAEAAFNPLPALLARHAGGMSKRRSQANKAYRKALRAAEEAAWAKETSRIRGTTRAATEGRAVPASDRFEQKLMMFLMALAFVAVVSLLLAGMTSGDVLAGVKAVVKGALR